MLREKLEEALEIWIGRLHAKVIQYHMRLL